MESQWGHLAMIVEPLLGLGMRQSDTVFVVTLINSLGKLQFLEFGHRQHYAMSALVQLLTVTLGR